MPTELVEILKAITGNDALDVNGKGRDIVSEPLPGKVFASSNDLIVFNDPSGVLFDRFVCLKFTRSFLPPDHPEFVEGQEQDPELEDKLEKELPGILNWAIAGLHRLRKQKRFTQPASSIGLRNELAEDGSPIKRFVGDCLIRVASGRALVDATYETWVLWCGDNDLDAGTKRPFGKLLKAACPWITREKVPTGDEPRPHEYRGLEIRNTVKRQAPV